MCDHFFSIWTNLHAQLHKLLLHRQLLPKNQRILVAVSGGQDSLCLIKLLLDLQPKWGWDLAIVHCDHRWRNDSKENADRVAELATNWQVPFYRQIAQEIPKTEAIARQWRYESIAEVAIAHHYPYIVTGHTKSDRAETLLYNLIRGSGAEGLSALTWQRPLIENRETTPHLLLVRPMLEITRTQTGTFCQEQNLPIWEDSTNQDLHYARNRIRNELLPYLQTHFNPQAEQALAQTAELLRADADYLEIAATQLRLQASFSHVSKEKYRINRRVLQGTHAALQRRAIRQLLQEILPVAPNFTHIEKIRELITAPNKSQTDPFPGGAIAIVEDPWINITT
ncbi:tRNA lysidine(34) synthetase TilS [Oscillatoriales cyanobacterium USR001]|nr:tRNA lysidine(34) synthetase TilS [Oscillatoriales cyanobacterium USR001]